MNLLKKWFSKHQHTAKFNKLDDSGVLNSVIKVLMTSTASTASVALMT